MWIHGREVGGTITENIAGPHLSISVSSVYPSCIYFLSLYVSLLCVSLIYFSASLSIQPPFHRTYQSIYLSCLSIIYLLILYLPIISIPICLFIYSFTHSSIPLIYPFRYPICHPYLSLYLPPLSMSLIYFSASLSIDPPFHPSYLPICLSYPSYPSIICLPMHLSTHQSISLVLSSHSSILPFHLCILSMYHLYLSIFVSSVYLYVFSTFPSEHTDINTWNWRATTFPNTNVLCEMTARSSHSFPLGKWSGHFSMGASKAVLPFGCNKQLYVTLQKEK